MHAGICLKRTQEALGSTCLCVPSNLRGRYQKGDKNSSSYCNNLRAQVIGMSLKSSKLFDTCRRYHGRSGQALPQDLSSSWQCFHISGFILRQILTAQDRRDAKSHRTLHREYVRVAPCLSPTPTLARKPWILQDGQADPGHFLSIEKQHFVRRIDTIRSLGVLDGEAVGCAMHSGQTFAQVGISSWL